MRIRSKQLKLCIASLVCWSVGVQAQSGSDADAGPLERWTHTQSEREAFRAREWTVDVSGHWEQQKDGLDAFFTDSANEAWGGNLGVNYFFSRNFGLGLNASANDNGGAFIDSAAADLILRFPIDRISTAPYLIGGAGRVFEPSSLWEAHAGLGVEFRISPRVGVFADGRYLWVEDGYDRSQVRVGFRFAF